MKEEAQEKRRGRIPRWALRWIGPVLFAGLWWLSDLGEARSLIGRMRTLPLLAAAGMNLAVIGVKAWRWRDIMRAQAIHYPYPLAVRSYAIAMALAAWTPGKLGDFSRAVSVSRERNVSFGSAASSVIADRLLDFLVLTIVAAAGAGLLLGPVTATVTWCLVALAVVFAYILARWASVSGARRTREALLRVGLAGAGAQMGDALEGLQQMTGSPGRRILISALPSTLVGVVLTFLQWYLIVWSMGVDVSFFRVAAGLSAGTVASLLPVTISGIGLREMTLAVFLGPAGVGLGEVLALSIALLIVINGGFALIGAIVHAAWPKPGNGLEPRAERGESGA